MSLLAHIYSVLAFAEILTLVTSVIGVLVLAVRLAVRAINSVIDAAIDSTARDAEPRDSKPARLNVAVESRFHKIPGGHNEHF
jgi:4-hydroxybenzoate polyprenyltransferase